MYTTGGSVTDNLAIGPNDVARFTLTAPSDPRLPGGGGQTVGPLYNTNPTVFGQVNNRIVPTDKIGDDTRLFNGVDVTFNLRNAKGITFSGGTSTGKVENDWCDIRAAVPENFPRSNPYCNVRVAVADVASRPRGLHHPARRRATQLGGFRTSRTGHGPDRVDCGQLHADGGGSGRGRSADWSSVDDGRRVHRQPGPAGRGLRGAPAVGHLGEEDLPFRRPAV